MRNVPFFVFFILLTISLAPLNAANPLTAKGASGGISSPLSGGLNISALINVQNQLRSAIARAFNNIKQSQGVGNYLGLLLLALIYGIFHAASPGHRKTIVFSVFLSKKTHIWDPLFAGLFVAAIHVLTSITLVFVIYFFASRLRFTLVDQTSQFLDMFSLSLLALLIAALLINKIYKMTRKSPEQQEYMLHSKDYYSTLFISALVPCPAATIILIFSISLNMLAQGMFAVIIMSLGMGLTISMAGYLAYFGKEALFRAFKQEEEKLRRAADYLELIGLSLVLLLTLFMIWPYYFRSI